MTRHTTCHGMDGKLDLHTVFLKISGKQRNICLRLRKCHAIARNDDHLFGFPESGGDIGLAELCRSCFFGFFLFPGRFCRHPGAYSGFTGEDRDQLAVHGLAHILGQDQAGSTHDTTDRYQQGLVNGHTGNAACHTGQCIQQRNGNGHICTAHAHHKDNTDRQGQHRHQNSPSAAMERLQQDACHTQHRQHHHHSTVMGQALGPGIQNSCQLTGSDQASGKGKRTDRQGKTGSRTLKQRNFTVDSRNSSHQCGGRTAKAVEQGNDLRHGDHLRLHRTVDTHSSTGNQRCTQGNDHRHPGSSHAGKVNKGDGHYHGCGRQGVTQHRAFDLAHHVNA